MLSRGLFKIASVLLLVPIAYCSAFLVTGRTDLLLQQLDQYYKPHLDASSPRTIARSIDLIFADLEVDQAKKREFEAALICFAVSGGGFSVFNNLVLSEKQDLRGADFAPFFFHEIDGLNAKEITSKYNMDPKCTTP